MKFFVDGDQLAVVSDDFIDLQESPVVFIPAGTNAGLDIILNGLESLPIKVSLDIENKLTKNRPDNVVVYHKCLNCGEMWDKFDLQLTSGTCPIESCGGVEWEGYTVL